MRHRITLVREERISTLKLMPNAYSLNERGKAPWLQRLCFKVLSRLNCVHSEEVVKYQQYDIDTEDLMKKIFESVDGIQNSFNTKPDLLLVGGDDWAELMHSVRPEQGFQFMADYRRGPSVMGLMVHVVPWMNGILPLHSKDLIRTMVGHKEAC